MWTDLRFIKLDDAVKRGGFYIPLLEQNRLDRTYPQFYLGKMGAKTGPTPET
jgi:hypothetical protein